MHNAYQRAPQDASWDWTSDRWAWSPLAGRWSLSLGLPKAPIYFEVSTDGVPFGSRYDYWRSLVYYSFDADPPEPCAPPSFSARTQCLVGDPAQVYLYRSDPVSGRGIPAAKCDDRETYVIGLVLQGERRYREEDEPGVISRANDFFVFDNRWHSRVEWSRHRALHLSLARADLEQTLGGDIPPPVVMTRLLERSRLGAALKNQLQVVTRHMAGANDMERNFLLGQLTQFALFTCESATADPSSASPRKTDLRGAAMQMIEQNLAKPGFGVKALQSQLRCSRATLYRAFAASEVGINELITDMRIERAKVLLERSPTMPVNLVGARCGWHDGASFARAFRRGTGMSPSEYREYRRAFEKRDGT